MIIKEFAWKINMECLSDSEKEAVYKWLMKSYSSVNNDFNTIGAYTNVFRNGERYFSGVLSSKHYEGTYELATELKFIFENKVKEVIFPTIEIDRESKIKQLQCQIQEIKKELDSLKN